MAPDPNQENLNRSSNVHYVDEKKGKGGLIALVIILVLVVAAILLLVLDVGGTRTSISQWLSNAPIIGGLFSGEEEDDPLDSMSEAEMRNLIRNYRNQIGGLNARLNEANENLATANARINHLTRFETRWNEYRTAVATFTQMLAHNDPINFVETFQHLVTHDIIPQDILDAAFLQAAEINQSNEELMAHVRTLNAREPARVAEDIERLMRMDAAYTIRLLNAMGTSRRAEILDEMESENSTRLIFMLSTSPPVFSPLVPPPYLPEISPPATPGDTEN